MTGLGRRNSRSEGRGWSSSQVTSPEGPRRNSGPNFQTLNTFPTRKVFGGPLPAHPTQDPAQDSRLLVPGQSLPRSRAARALLHHREPPGRRLPAAGQSGSHPCRRDREWPFLQSETSTAPGTLPGTLPGTSGSAPSPGVPRHHGKIP